MSYDRKYGTSRAAHFTIEDRNKCFVCNEFVPDNEPCPACGFPQNGSEVEQRRFLGQLRVDKKNRNIAAGKVGHTFHLLLWVPGMLFILAYALWKGYDSVFAAQVCFLLGLTFTSIWIFGRRHPYRAFVVSLALYAAISVPLFIYQPSIIFKTGFFLLAPYIYLPLGMRAYRNWDELDQKVEGKNSG